MIKQWSNKISTERKCNIWLQDKIPDEKYKTGAENPSTFPAGAMPCDWHSSSTRQVVLWLWQQWRWQWQWWRQLRLWWLWQWWWLYLKFVLLQVFCIQRGSHGLPPLTGRREIFLKKCERGNMKEKLKTWKWKWEWMKRWIKHQQYWKTEILLRRLQQNAICLNI